MDKMQLHPSVFISSPQVANPCGRLDIGINLNHPEACIDQRWSGYVHMPYQRCYIQLVSKRSLRDDAVDGAAFRKLRIPVVCLQFELCA